MIPDPIDVLISANAAEAAPGCECGTPEVLIDGQWWACPRCQPATARSV